MPEFELQKEEKIIEELKPILGGVALDIIWGPYLLGLGHLIFRITILIVALIFLPFNVLLKILNIPTYWIIILYLILILIVLLSLFNLHVKKLVYWITNKRLIIKKDCLAITMQ